MRMFFIHILLLLHCSINGIAQTFTVSGYVIDGQTEETLIGANVQVKGQLRGAATDGNGYFRIVGLSPGKTILIFSYIGYETKELMVQLTESKILSDTPLTPKPVELKSVVIRAKRSEVADTEIESSHRVMLPRAIQRIPTSRGDIFRAIKFLPGVEGVDPISPLFSVRGSDPGENLILLDGVPIYNPYHCITSASLFNIYAMKNVEMLLGGWGAEYGGRNASILYITTREGNSQKLHGEIAPGLSSTRMVFDFPVGENATMMISGRAYYDLISRFLLYSPSYLFDGNISLNWKLHPRHRLSLRYFHSKDMMDFQFSHFMSYFSKTFDTDIFDQYDINYQNRWQNQAATLILKSIISPSTYLKAQVSGSFFSAKNYSLLHFEYEDKDEDEKYKLYYQTDIRNHIRDIGGKITLTTRWPGATTLTVGGEFNQYHFRNDIQINLLGQGKTTREPDLLAGFIEEKIPIQNVSFRAGLRMSRFSFTREWKPEPRINLVCSLPGAWTLRSAWGRFYQYIISINSQEYEISQFLDYYYPLETRRPSQSEHTIIGLDKAFNSHLTLSTDFYYKDLARVYAFDYNISDLEAYQFSDKVIGGSGSAYGGEVQLKGSWQKFSGWISYGYSQSKRSYPHIMDGQSFLFDYDRTHAFKLMISHQMHPHLAYNATLRILSGVPISLERSTKSYFYYEPVQNEISSYPIYVTPAKNNARLPLFVRLDLGIKKRIRKGFGADLAKYLGADASYLSVTLGNLLFIHRNVMLYLPTGQKEMYGMGTNYIPEFNAGYTIRF